MKANNQAGGSKHAEKEGATWKHKAQGIVNTDGPRKKRDNRGYDYSSSLASKGWRGNGQAVNQTGSGMAAAVAQTRRPQ
jgi:hypothetical protein